MAFPQRANPIDAMEILNAMEPMIHYESKSIAKYHFHFARLVIQEFLEDSASNARSHRKCTVLLVYKRMVWRRWTSL